ncbi:MAG TPA: DNA repair protein RecO [Gemmatimonadales bacterium]|nr:DNA repair protein RecO [Gemmatimonadales bacterium]
MAPVATPALVLATLRYGDTSKIVRLATRDLGVQSAIAKGALRPRSRFGAALQVLSEGTAQLYLKEGRELQTLGAFDLTRLRVELAGDLPRYAAANALAEVMLRCGAPVAQPEAYDALRDALDALTLAPGDAVDVIALRMLWRLVGVLGFAPALDHCAKCGAPLSLAAGVAFSPRDGGALCARDATGLPVSRLGPEDAADLRRLVTGVGELHPLEPKHAAAHRRLLARWVREHLGEGAPLPALEYWQDPARETA